MKVRVELYDVRRTRFIQAHAAALACLTLSQDGRLLATASERGTLVRIHSTADGSRLQARSNTASMLALGRHTAPKGVRSYASLPVSPSLLVEVCLPAVGHAWHA